MNGRITKKGRLMAYGFSRNGRSSSGIGTAPNEQVVIQRMLRRKMNGWSYRQIAGDLNEHSIQTKSGKGRWRHGTVARIVQRELKK